MGYDEIQKIITKLGLSPFVYEVLWKRDESYVSNVFANMSTPTREENDNLKDWKTNPTDLIDLLHKYKEELKEDYEPSVQAIETLVLSDLRQLKTRNEIEIDEHKLTYCDSCDAYNKLYLRYNCIEKYYDEELDKTYEIRTPKAFCRECGAEAYISYLVGKNTEKFSDMMRKDKGLVSREELNLMMYRLDPTIQELEILTGLSASTISRMLNGRTPTEEINRKLKLLVGDFDKLRRLVEFNRNRLEEDSYAKLMNRLKEIEIKEYEASNK